MLTGLCSVKQEIHCPECRRHVYFSNDHCLEFWERQWHVYFSEGHFDQIEPQCEISQGRIAQSDTELN